jgi:hypothetical protein
MKVYYDLISVLFMSWSLTWIWDSEPRWILNNLQFEICPGWMFFWKIFSQGQYATYPPHRHDG